ncbi:hypothetical protein HF521_016832 [Silurus meridionalis]|uniref:Uncharacterized protein n=1 Tax=Silurus meridionalis TaxID=175797 RepID=A0A8T0BRP3_SILME|nr:hypothetical protein HF521_016832 [Silurus meridionalis]
MRMIAFSVFLPSSYRTTGAEFPSDAVKAVCQRHQHISAASTEPDFQMLVPVECLAIEASAIPVGFCQADVLGSCTLPQISLQDWAREQRQDPVISRVIELVKARKRLSYRLRRQEDREVQLMLRIMEQLVFSDEVLYRKRISQAEEDGELSEEEDEAEYYSLYDQPSTSTIAGQDRGILQEETRLKQRSHAVEFTEEDTQMENEPVSGSQEANVSFDVSTLNPAAPAFEPEDVRGDRNSEASQVRYSPAPEIGRAEGNPPTVPELDLSEHCSPRDGLGIGLMLTEESGNVKEHKEVASEEEPYVPPLSKFQKGRLASSKFPRDHRLRCRNKKRGIRCRNPGSNQGPLDLQSNASQLSYFGTCFSHIPFEPKDRPI